MDANTKLSAAFAVGCLLGAALTLTMNLDNYYRDGQAAALRNHWEYERVIKPGGGEEIVRLEKPTTMPVTVGR